MPNPTLSYHASPQVDFGFTRPPRHISAEMLSYLPKARAPDSLMLDLGCGNGIHKDLCTAAGFRWIGVDYSSPGAPILADGHALPFANETFEAILSIAVLEHVECPVLFLEEAFRILKPGGTLIGTVAFLEPHHQGSFYHHSHLGIYKSLIRPGFIVEHVATVPRWPALRALAQMKLFPGMPKLLAWCLVSPIQILHLIWWRVGRFARPGATDLVRGRDTAGAFFLWH